MENRVKLSYKNSEYKRNIQEYIYSKVGNRNIIGLPGPDIEDYVERLTSFGFDNIELYEKDFSIFCHQLSHLPPQCNLTFGDILDNLNKDAFYDLDFCTSILSIEDRLEEIVALKSFSLTVARRPIPEEETIDIMDKYMPGISHLTYFDTSPMIVFFKI